MQAYRDLIDNHGVCRPNVLMRMAHNRAKVAMTVRFNDQSYSEHFQEALFQLWGWVRALQFEHSYRLSRQAA